MKPGVKVAAASAELNGLAKAFANEFPVTNGGWQAVVQPVSEQLLGNLRQVLLRFWARSARIANRVPERYQFDDGARHRTLARDGDPRRTRRKPCPVAPADAARKPAARGCRWGHSNSVRVRMAAGVRGVAPWRQRATGRDQATVDGTVLMVAFGASIATGVVFGLLPAWRVSKTDWVAGRTRAACARKACWRV